MEASYLNLIPVALGMTFSFLVLPYAHLYSGKQIGKNFSDFVSQTVIRWHQEKLSTFFVFLNPFKQLYSANQIGKKFSKKKCQLTNHTSIVTLYNVFSEKFLQSPA
jgi:hypothetical protein